MNILYITDEVQVGGSFAFQLGLITHLQKTDVVQLILFANEKKQPLFLYTRNFPGHIRISLPNHFSKSSLFQRLRKLWSFINSSSVSWDVIIVDMTRDLLIISVLRIIISKIRKKKYIAVFHGSQVLQDRYGSDKGWKRKLYYSLYMKLESFLYKFVDMVIVLSLFAKNQVISELFIPVEKISILRPGTEATFSNMRKKISHKQAKHLLGIDSDRQLFVAAGRIENRKGLLQLIQSYHNWKPSRPTTLIVLSDFSEVFQDIFGRYSSDFDFSKQLYLVHKTSREGLALHLRAADCVLMPSVALETFGFLTLETLTVGQPIVGFDLGANSELIPKSNLIPFRNTNVDSFYSLLTKAEEISSDRSHLNSKPIKELEKEFRWETSVKKFRGLLSSDNPKHISALYFFRNILFNTAMNKPMQIPLKTAKTSRKR